MPCSHQHQDDFEAPGWCPRCHRITDCYFVTCSCIIEPQGRCTECDGDPSGRPEVVYRDPEELRTFAAEQPSEAEHAVTLDNVRRAVSLGTELITLARESDDGRLVERLADLDPADLVRATVYLARMVAQRVDPDFVSMAAMAAQS